MKTLVLEFVTVLSVMILITAIHEKKGILAYNELSFVRIAFVTIHTK